MAHYETKQIRNIALLGHGGSGKTSLVEAMLYLSKKTDRLGSVTDGNTVCDYDPEEIKRGFTLSLSIAPVEWKGVKANFLDTPGYLDFSGEAAEALRVADSAIIVVDGKAGVEVGTELAWQKASDAGIPKAFFINKFDDPEARFGKIFKQLKEQFGVSICPLLIPMVENGNVTGFLNLINNVTHIYDKSGAHVEGAIPEEFKTTAAEYRDMLLEAIAQTSDELMEKYFNGEEIGYDEAVEAIHEGIISGDIAPCICGASTKMWAVEELLNVIADSFPRHTAKKTETAEDGEPIVIDKESNETAVFIFKTQSDQYGKLSYFKVMNGELKADAILKNSTNEKTEKLAHIYTICGKKQTEVDSLSCGDIGVIAKLGAATNDTLSVSGKLTYQKIKFPTPYYARAVLPKSKGDEDKISQAMKRLIEEDYTLRYENHAETKQQIITGLGDMHLDVAMSKMKTKSGVGIDLAVPKTAYRETIKKRVQADGKHKKQSGGSGQYGHVKITFSPGETDGLTFTQSVVGGSVPKGYYPAVEKGLLESMQKGVLAGFPVVGLAADLYDGSYHPVDSNEISFKMAAHLAYKEGLPKANPIILEPICELQVSVPETMVGDVMGDMPKRRGRVLGMNPEPNKKGYTIIEAEVPQAEMTDYTIDLRAMTQGRGSYSLQFARYEEVPAADAQKIISNAQKEKEI
ncbi:MAG: elongation factor G [Clostridiales bacterium]|nr:elongation factor G [Clostridiales bacterium]